MTATAPTARIDELRRLAADLTRSASGEIADLAELVGVILDLVAPPPAEPLSPTRERDRLLCEAAARFCAGTSKREQAKRLFEALRRYRAGPAWRRERTAKVCPYPDTNLRAWLWRVLRVKDWVPCDRVIRDALASGSGWAVLGSLQLPTDGEIVLDTEEQEQK